MKKRDFTDLARNPNYIPGIYDYCDRWCERCAFISRCMVFAMERAERQLPGQIDVRNEAFWKKLEASLRITTVMLQEFAAERGIAPDSKELESIGRDQRRSRRSQDKHPLAQAALAYLRRVDRWFKDEKTLLFEKEEEVETKARLGVAGVKQEVASLTDVVEIIRWYQHQVYVKLRRALDHNGGPAGDAAGVPTDSEGSAKVALIGIDRSIAAWARMREHFPASADEILSFLIDLDRLRRAVEKEFPGARSFVRPGFDSPVPFSQ